MIPDHLIARWGLSGPISRIESGRINDTYQVDQKFVIQRINARVFRDPVVVIRNYRAVHDCVFDLIAPLVPTIDEKDFVVDFDGHLWRTFVYFEARTFRELPDALCRAAGEAFGLFLDRLENCKNPIQSAILGFHQLNGYLDQLRHAGTPTGLETDMELLESLLENRVEFDARRQVIHGDCKVSNLLFHPTEPRVLRIVDLDTVMFGHPALDFGDLVRSLTTGVDVVSLDSARVRRRIEELCKGFFKHVRLKSDAAVCQYAGAPAHMALMLGVRYLADHLLGDQYFKVNAPGENLARARRQFEMSARLRSMQSDLEDYIANVGVP